MLRSLLARSRSGSPSHSGSRAFVALATLVVPALSVAPAAHAVVPAYTLVGQFPLPAGAWDIDASGRILAVASTGQIVRQTLPNSSTYTPLGSIDGSIFAGPFGNFGASFLSISPDGNTLAIGDNDALSRVHFVQTASLSTTAASSTTFIASPNSDAAWDGNATLYVTGSFAPSAVRRLDLAEQTATTVISGANAAAGVAIRSGVLYSADGFNTSSAGAPTGNVRAFNLATLATANAAAQFETGTLVADALSGASLGFDPFGNLLVGGGDFFAGSDDAGYAAIIDANAIADALAGGPVAPDSAELRLSPAGSDFYGIRFNTATQELIVSASGTAYRFAIPAPGALSLLAMGSALAARRRRAAPSRGHM